MTNPLAIPTSIEIETLAPRAARLICGVADQELDDMRAALAGLDQRGLRALAIHLARLVRDDTLAGAIHGGLTTHQQFDLAVNYAAAAWRTTPDAIRSRSRAREVADARAVVMAALRLAGHSTPVIGRALDRDHSTVLHACSRVGENPRLQRIARRIADKLGATHTRGVLGDERDDEGDAA